MERSEPALVPEWLRCSGSVTGGGSTVHHFASSSDVPSSTISIRNKAFRSINDKDSPRSFLDRSSSSNSRRISSSNGSSKHPYSSFTRSHRDKSRDKEKDRPAIRDLWNQDIADPITSVLGKRVDNTLRRSQSMVSRKPGEPLPRRSTELRDGSISNHSSENGMLSGGGSVMRGVQKVAFEKEFPSLGFDEKQGGSDVGRVLSPGFGTAVQSLPIGNSGLIGGECWTSALAEVPAIIGSSIIGTTSSQCSLSSPSSAVTCSTGSLNMAETLSQAPSRMRTTPQKPDKIQRLEELAIKQSRQLIPMRPTTPKPLVVNSSDKSKQQPKATVRANDTTGPTKSAQQHSFQMHSASQSPRVGQISSDSPKMSHVGKFLVLKPLWENGVASTVKDGNFGSNGNSTARGATSQVPVAPAPPLSSPNHAITERKSSFNSKSIAEKKASLSQAQSRNDFFNLMRKNSSNSPAIAPHSSPAIKNEVINGVGDDPQSPCVTENGNKITSNGDNHEGHGFSNNVEKNLCLDEAVYPDEEEAAFLRSLGWEENDGNDEGLTEEEINAFYQEYMKLIPSLKVCRAVQPKPSVLSESYGSK